MTGHVGIAAIAYAFAGPQVTVRQLAAAGRLESAPEVLEGFGFDTVHVAGRETPYDLALDCSRRALRDAGVAPAEVGLLIHGGATGEAAFAPGGGAAGCPGPSFRFPSTRLQHALELDDAWTFGLDQMACTNLLAAIRVGAGLMRAEGIRRALCVTSEFFGPGAPRERIYNCVSDAACAVLLDRDAPGCRLVAAVQVTKGYYWDAEAARDEVVASYFPTSRHVIERTLERAGWSAASVDWVIPHNVSARSWAILGGLLRLPRARVWIDNIARRGHTLAGDNLINLRDALDAGHINPGERLLLFSYGYGAHWTALAVEA
ncbi:MAG TPA: 3-oxoacyl-[acyl-carrier-protein] synthase III C-terminal domain-containing protein [Longimicrobiales bacterium]|nr:3-oxoacyl-[acyl-carrier-protein] synthase III C-terminal domain-containing protein [Longimicrobiales bacterium]